MIIIDVIIIITIYGLQTIATKCKVRAIATASALAAAVFVVRLLCYVAGAEGVRVHVLLATAVTLGGVRQFAADVIFVRAVAKKLAREHARLFSEGH